MKDMVTVVRIRYFVFLFALNKCNKDVVACNKN